MKSSRRWSNIIKPALAVSSLVALAGCAKDAPQDTWQPAGPNAKMIDDLQRPIFYIAGIVGLIVFAAVAWAVFRFRDRGQAMPEQEMADARAATLDADLFLSIGSSLQVFPAAGFPVLAKQNRTPLVIINRESTGLDGLADLVINAEIAPVMAALMARTDSH